MRVVDQRPFDETELADISKRFEENGASIAQWAIERGFSSTLVYAILASKRRCLRGQSHKIATALGLKRPTSRPLPDSRC